jgi:hypothetical protein
LKKRRERLLITVTGWYPTKRPMQLRPFSDLFWSTSRLLSFPIHPPEVSALVAAEKPSSEAERKWARNGWWILPVIICVVPQGIF